MLDLLKTRRNWLVLTGAGVSTSSGIPDFKTLDTTWPFTVPREIAISRDYMYMKPEEFWSVYKYIFLAKKVSEHSPSAFHKFLANVEEMDDAPKITVATQNIDGLHARAGSKNVLEVHGSIQNMSCTRKRGCGHSVPTDRVINEEKAPRCGHCGKYLRPEVVLFNEIPLQQKELIKALNEIDLLVVAGTSLRVYPIANIPQVLRLNRPSVPQVWINRDLPPNETPFGTGFLGDLEYFSKVATTAIIDKV